MKLLVITISACILAVQAKPYGGGLGVGLGVGEGLGSGAGLAVGSLLGGAVGLGTGAALGAGEGLRTGLGINPVLPGVAVPGRYGSGNRYGSQDYRGGSNGYNNGEYQGGVKQYGHDDRVQESEYDSSVHSHKTLGHSIGGELQVGTGSHGASGYNRYGTGHGGYGNSWVHGGYLV